MYLSLVVAVAVQHDTAAVAVPAASQHRMDTRLPLVKHSTCPLVRVALVEQVLSTAMALLALMVQSQVSRAVALVFEVVEAKAANAN
jgi:hypothetical protein